MCGPSLCLNIDVTCFCVLIHLYHMSQGHLSLGLPVAQLAIKTNLIQFILLFRFRFNINFTRMHISIVRECALCDF